QIGAVEASAAGQHERIAVGPDALDAETAVDRPGIPRFLQPCDLEPLAEATKIEFADRAVSAELQGPRMRIDRARRAWLDARAEEDRSCELRAAGDVRVGELAVDVVIEGQRRFDVRNRHVLWNTSKIDAARDAPKPEVERVVDADGAFLDRE